MLDSEGTLRIDVKRIQLGRSVGGLGCKKTGGVREAEGAEKKEREGIKEQKMKVEEGSCFSKS